MQKQSRFHLYVNFIFFAVIVVALVDDHNLWAQNTSMLAVEETLDAMHAARLAAENGDVAKSLDLVKSHLQEGPPKNNAAAQAIGTLFGDDRAAKAVDPTIVPRIAEKLLGLCEMWETQNADAKQVYETLQAIVLPQSSKNVEWYRLQSEMEFPRNVGSELVRWAFKAAATQELRTQLSKRFESQSNPLSIALLIELAHMEGNEQQAEITVRDLKDRLSKSVSAAEAEAFLPGICLAFQNELTQGTALDALEIVIEKMSTDAVKENRWLKVASLRKFAARRRYDLFDPERGNQHLEAMLELFQQIEVQNAIRNRGGDQQERYYEVAMGFLYGGEVESALKVIAEVGRNKLQPFEESGGIAGHLGAALNRRLQALDAGERYELLHEFCFADSEELRLNQFSAITPTQSPPSSFARLLGERPSDHSFAVPHVGSIDGLFSTSWLLAQTANQSGRLRTLQTEIEELVSADDPSAIQLDLLLRLVQSPDQNSAKLESIFLNNVESFLSKDTPPHVYGHQSVLIPEIVTAAAATSHPSLQSAAVELFDRLIEYRKRNENQSVMACLRRARAAAIAQNQNLGWDEFREKSQPVDWLSSGYSVSQSGAVGVEESLWFTHDDHVLHLAGPQKDYLCYRYPLTGEFAVEIKTQTGQRTDGNVVFNGLVYDANGSGSRALANCVNGNLVVNRAFPFIRTADWPTYFDISLDATAETSSVRLSGHPLHTETRNSNDSPWIAFHSDGGESPAFRDFKITGNPIVPNEVALIGEDASRGWISGYYAESLVDGNRDTVNTHTAPDWAVHDGVLTGYRTGATFRESQQSRLFYFRPLANGESVSYEFRYVPGQVIVHPTLGRVAFLLEPSGVRVHWLTEGANDWTGLPEDNANIEPLDRRGPRPIPLKEDDWNSITISRDQKSCRVFLNDKLVYERKLTANLAQHFGFYRNKSHEQAEVRNVLMKGNWSEAFAKTSKGLILGPVDSTVSEHTKQTLTKIFDDRHLVDEVLDVHRQAMQMPAEERYEFLVDWVFPKYGNVPIRLNLDFTPLHPAPLPQFLESDDLELLQWAKENKKSRIQVGGQVVSPAIDLLHVAKELSQLEELQARLDAVSQREDPFSMKSLHAFGGVLDALRGDVESALNEFGQLHALLKEGNDVSFQQRWPVTFVMHQGLQIPEVRNAAKDLAFDVFLQQGQGGDDGGSGAWRQQLRKFAGLSWKMDQQPEVSEQRLSPIPPHLKQWDLVTTVTNWSRGNGCPPSEWWFDGQKAGIVSSSLREYLYYQSPLRGDFIVEADFPTFGFRDSEVFYSGVWVGPRYRLDQYYLGTLNGENGLIPLQRKMVKPDDTHHVMLKVSNHVATWRVNGRLLHTERLPEGHDPWLALRNMLYTLSFAENVRISGTPVIPDEIDLLADPRFAGWFKYYINDELGLPTSHWKLVQLQDGTAELVATKNGNLEGTQLESAVVYHRPMLEDGEISYEFFYVPDQTIVHPALDRQVFILNDDGVAIHWMTDGPYERNGMAADNLRVETDHQRGPDALPLKPREWNQVQLSLKGDVVTLKLNEQLIYECPLDASTQRTFGLFHYADQSFARVRNMTWRGDWPKTLPTHDQQEFPTQFADFLDENIEHLQEGYVRDFTKDSVPIHEFILPNPDHYSIEPNGIRVHRKGIKGYHDVVVAPQLTEVAGDYDITMEYQDYTAAPTRNEGNIAIALAPRTIGPVKKESRVLRRTYALDAKGEALQAFQAATIDIQGRDRAYSFTGTRPNEATSGRIRIARRGTTAYFMVAETDSPNYRIIHTAEVGNAPLETNGVRMFLQTHNDGAGSFLITGISVRAESITKGFVETDDTRSAGEIVKELNEQREQLVKEYTHKFSEEGFTNEEFYTWGDDSTGTMQPKEQGLQVNADGFKNWRSVGAGLMQTIRGDFDVSFVYDPIEMESDVSNSRASVYLQVEFSDVNRMQASTIFSRYPSGKYEVVAQAKDTRGANANTGIAVGRHFVEKMERARIARRGTRLYYLYAEDLDKEDTLLGVYEATDADVGLVGIKMLVHNGSVGRTTRALWKKIDVAADEIDQYKQPIPTQQPASPPPPTENSFFRALKNLFD